MNQTYDEAFERLKSNPEEVRAEVQEFHREMKNFLQQVRDEAEKDIPETPNVPINYMQLRRESNPADKLLALGIAYQIRENGRKDLLQDLENLYPNRKRLSGNYIAKISSLVQEYVEDDSIWETPGGRFSTRLEDFSTLLKLSDDFGHVNVFYIPKETFPNIEIPEIIRQFIEEEFIVEWDFKNTSVKPSAYFEALIVHEYTHAYINAKRRGFTHANVRANGTKFDSMNVNEAAAQAITSIYVPSREINIEFYQTTGSGGNLSRAFMQFFKACFLSHAQKFDSRPEKVYQIRKRAVKAINRFQTNQFLNVPDVLTGGNFTKLPIVKKFALTETVLGEENHELLTFAKAVYYLEEAEKLSFHGLVLLNILPPDEAKEHIYELDNELESTFDPTMKQLFPEEGFIGKAKGRSGILYEVGESVTEATGSSEVRYEKTEFRDSILQIKQGIEQIENQLVENEDLNKEEKKLLEQLVVDLREAIEAYEEENKVERTYEEEWSQEFDAEVSEIAEWVKERVADGDYTDPVRVSRNMMLQLDSIVEDYFKVIEAGENYNSKILKALKNLHGDENQALEILERHKDKREYQEMNQMLQITEKIYELVENAQENFESALDNLENAQEELPKN